MKCEDIQGLFSGYVDGELDPEKRELVKEHLSECRTCQEEWREFNQVVQITRSLPEIESPSDLLQRVREGVGPSSKRGRILRRIARPPSFRVPAWSLAAVVLLMVLYFGRIFPFPEESAKLRTEGTPPSSTESDRPGITEGKEITSGEVPSLDVVPHKEELRAKEREEPMRVRAELGQEDRLAPEQTARVPLPGADDRDGVLSFRSISRLEQTSVSIAGPIMARKILKMVEPNYPAWIEEREVEGTVEVMCRVLPSGEVATPAIWLRSEWPELDQSLVQAMGKWRFESIPGEEVQAGIVRIAFDFSG